MNFCVQFLSHFEEQSFSRYSVKELIHWHLFSIDMTSWPQADHVHSSLSKSNPMMERWPVSACSRAHSISSHTFTWQFVQPNNHCPNLQQAMFPVARLKALGFLIPDLAPSPKP